MPGLLRAAVAARFRALARGATTARGAIGHAAARVLWRCETTHVLSPAWLVPRRRDGAQVIGEALRQAAAGAGHRVIARRLGRPPGTVRGWLRAARARSELLRASAVRWACALDAGELARVAPAGSSLGDTVEALAIAVRAWALRFGNQHAGGWELAWDGGGADRRAAARRAATAAVAGGPEPAHDRYARVGSHRSPSHARATGASREPQPRLHGERSIAGAKRSQRVTHTARAPTRAPFTASL